MAQPAMEGPMATMQLYENPGWGSAIVEAQMAVYLKELGYDE